MIAETLIVAGAFALAGLLLIYAARKAAPGRGITDRQEVDRHRR